MSEAPVSTTISLHWMNPMRTLVIKKKASNEGYKKNIFDFSTINCGISRQKLKKAIPAPQQKLLAANSSISWDGVKPNIDYPERHFQLRNNILVFANKNWNNSRQKVKEYNPGCSLEATSSELNQFWMDTIQTLVLKKNQEWRIMNPTLTFQLPIRKSSQEMLFQKTFRYIWLLQDECNSTTSFHQNHFPRKTTKTSNFPIINEYPEKVSKIPVQFIKSREKRLTTRDTAWKNICDKERTHEQILRYYAFSKKMRLGLPRKKTTRKKNENLQSYI